MEARVSSVAMRPLPLETAIKKCPFCAEDIRAEAIKCRYCGEMLDGSAVGGSREPTYETRTFVIPFPPETPPTQYVWQPQVDEPFSDDYLRAIGGFSRKTSKDVRRSFKSGITETWEAYKSHFLKRINELGREGWQLAEPFEHPVDGHGWLARPNDRFKIETVEVQRMFGHAKWHRLAGARFLMTRMTIGASPGGR